VNGDWLLYFSQIWDLASGHLKVSLTGHISSVRGLAVSARHPYLFSCGEDRQVKCWDLEYNKVGTLRKSWKLGERRNLECKLYKKSEIKYWHDLVYAGIICV
jgi:WD40 repeat protein